MAAATDIAQSAMPSIKMDPIANLPLSPTASTKDGQLPMDFDDLVNHTGTSPFAPGQFGVEPTGLANSFQDSGRTSPRMQHASFSSHSQYVPMLHQQQQHQQQHVYANEYTYLQDQSAYTQQDGVYPSPDEPSYNTPASSPSQRSDNLNARDGAVQVPNAASRPLASKARVQKPKRKRARDKSDREKVHLEKPLSEIGEEWKKSMLEIEAYINRSAEKRRQEISMDRKQPGKVKRPMNSFMLYRKAFQNHTKAYCEHNNHQVVSKVCGASWDQEPEHIRKQFADWAKMERNNHQKAHPGYKFTPAKPKNQKRRRDSDDETSDVEYEWETGRKARPMRSHTGTPTPEHELYTQQQGYYPPPPHYPQSQQILPPRSMLSSYGYSNPNKQMPLPYGSFGLNQAAPYNSMSNQHYQQHGYVSDNMPYTKTQSPGNAYSQPLQAGLLESYVSPPQRHTLEPTPPPAPAQYINDSQDAGLYTLNDGPFDTNNPLHLTEQSLENTSGVDFHNFHNVGGQQSLSDGLPNMFVHETLLQDQQAQQFLKGNDDSWDIQQLDDGQAGPAYDDWGVDPSLSQPYGVSDTSLSETYAAQD